MTSAAVEAAVRAAWVKAYGAASWEENRAFDDEGSDSLEILAVLLDIEDALDISIPSKVVSVEMTGRKLAGAVALLAGKAAEADDDRPLVFLFADGMSARVEGALRDGLARWFRFAAIDARAGAQQAAEQMRRADAGGVVNVIACGDAAAVAADAAALLVRKGLRRGFHFVLDPAEDARSAQTRIVDAFVASRHAAG